MDDSPAPVLAVDGLAKRFGGVLAVQGLSFSLQPGSLTGLIGPNGSGKSTVFNLVTAVERADAGRIRYRGQAIEGLPSHRIARLGLGRTFQLVRVFPRLTAIENLVVAAAGGHRGSHGRAEQLLEEFGLGHLRDEEAANLSYGQQKLLEFARLLMNHHDLILLDEPFAGINPTTANTLVDRIRSLHAAGVTVLIIDHAMRIIMDLCQTILVLNYGELIAQGPPAAIRDDQRVLDAYFGH